MNAMSRVLFALAAATALGVAGTASALPIVSGDGTETCEYGAPLASLSDTCTVELVTPHPRWQPPTGGGQWISYGPTGFQDAGPAAPFAGETAVFSVFETFSLAGAGELSIEVWADDTAEVFLNGISLNEPNFSQATCADGPLGCEPGEGVPFTALLEAGEHTLRFDVFQVGTGTTTRVNPFGLLYAGSVAAVPEPGTLALLGAGLAAVGFARRRRPS
jgi:hypothetical protein